jgi:hypothetical protein
MRTSAFGSQSGRPFAATSWAVDSQKEKSVLPEEVEHWSLTMLLRPHSALGYKPPAPQIIIS